MKYLFHFQPLIVLLSALIVSCSTLNAQSASGDSCEGYAVYYADSLQGNLTASGERYDKSLLTAAHRTLPFGTMIRVTNLINRQSVQVRVNDRGPFSGRRRIVDLSRAAALRIDMMDEGIIPVRIEIISMPK